MVEFEIKVDDRAIEETGKWRKLIEGVMEKHFQESQEWRKILERTISEEGIKVKIGGLEERQMKKK